MLIPVESFDITRGNRVEEVTGGFGLKAPRLINPLNLTKLKNAFLQGNFFGGRLCSSYKLCVREKASVIDTHSQQCLHGCLPAPEQLSSVNNARNSLSPTWVLAGECAEHCGGTPSRRGCGSLWTVMGWRGLGCSVECVRRHLRWCTKIRMEEIPYSLIRHLYRTRSGVLVHVSHWR